MANDLRVTLIGATIITFISFILIPEDTLFFLKVAINGLTDLFILVVVFISLIIFGLIELVQWIIINIFNLLFAPLGISWDNNPFISNIPELQTFNTALPSNRQEVWDAVMQLRDTLHEIVEDFFNRLNGD